MDDSKGHGSIYKDSRHCQETTNEVVSDFGDDDKYNFSNPRRGVAVIIFYEKDHEQNIRSGSENDLKCLQKLFSDLSFNVRLLINEKRAQLIENLVTVSKENHSDCDCFVLAVSSHGGEIECNKVKEDVILTTDHPVKTSEILEIFTDKSSPTLAGKPKLVFIQACRGEKTDGGLDIMCIRESKGEDVQDSISLGNDVTDVNPVYNLYNFNHERSLEPKSKNLPSVNNTYYSRPSQMTRSGRQVLLKQDVQMEPVLRPVPCYSDFLVMYATPPGYFAFRRQGDGSWFIKCLYEVLIKSDGKRRLMQDLTRVSGRVAHNYTSQSSDSDLNNKKQTPIIYSMLSKDIYLAPKGSI